MKARALGCAALLGEEGRAPSVVVWTRLALPPAPGRVLRPLPEVDLDDVPAKGIVQTGFFVLDRDASPALVLRRPDGQDVGASEALQGDELVVRRDRPQERWQLPGLRAWVRVHRGTSSSLVWPAPRALFFSMERRCAYLAFVASGADALGSERIDRLTVGLLPAASTTRLEAAASPERSPLAAVPLVNHAFMEATSLPFEIGPRSHALVVVVKGTFALVEGAAADLAAEQKPLTGEDVTAGAPPSPNDFVPVKDKADVMLVGFAYPKKGGRAARVDLQLGPLSASFAAFGERTYDRTGVPSEPAPFERLELSWKHALEDPPRIENPTALLRLRGDERRPVCPAPVPHGLAHRAKLEGTFDKIWVETRWPALPSDFDRSYFQSADAPLRLAEVRGDEAYQLKGVRPDGEGFAGRLPGVRARALVFASHGQRSDLPLRLDTVLFDSEARVVLLTWRGRVATPDPSASNVARVVVFAEPIAEPFSEDEVDAIASMAAERPAAREEAAASVLDDDEATGIRAARLHEMRSRHLALVPRMLARGEVAVFDRAEIAELVARKESLEGADLSGADLSGLDLRGITLARATLTGADLRGCNLDGVDGAEARVVGVDASGATFRGASFERALFASSKLEGCAFSGAKLTNADFCDADLTDANMSGADLSGARLVRAKASRLCADRIVAPKLDASDATLDKATFRWAKLEDARFDGCHGEGMVADEAVFTNSRWERSYVPKSSLKNTVMAGATFELTDLTGADLSGADISLGIFAGAKLERASFASALAKRAMFIASNASHTVFQGADLMWAKLERCSLEGATFHGANIFEVSWVGSSGMPRASTSRR